MTSTCAVGVLGSGTMGTGIAQVAAAAGHRVVLYDISPEALENARLSLEKVYARLVEKRRIEEAAARDILECIRYVQVLDPLAPCRLVVEAVAEDLEVKQQVFCKLEELVSEDAVLATNTSSLSVTAIASACQKPWRVLGTHFFNPVPLMALVEIVPGMATEQETIQASRGWIEDWGKTTVLCKDTPGFIVNRVARPFYGEALRILEEGIADEATIDWAMREIGGFRMGPFQLMDLIGNDINYAVTQTVFKAFFYDPRFKPSFTQQRMVEAGRLGRKSGRGYYDYSPDASNPEPRRDRELGEQILERILAMLINEAADAVFLNIASVEDVDLAMTKGVNYPKGLLRWADEMGPERVLQQLEALQEEYGEDRYRPNPLLKRLVRQGKSFYGG